MRGYAGVYALYNKERLYYVGLATNLYGRLRGHTKNRHKGKWDQFAIFRVRRVRYLKDMETLAPVNGAFKVNLITGLSF
jgi:predicted GIY-YIG superfamily endonuclease